jgi:hypothetical protein
MSFLNIQDPEKRDATIKEYLALKKKIKNRNLQEKARDFVNREMFEETLRPVLRSTVESTEAITKQLLPIKEGITTLNANFKHSAAKDKKDEDLDSGERDKDKEKDKDGDEDREKDEIYEKLMQDGKAKNLDKYFGILYNDEMDKHVMGDKIVNFGERGDIIVDGKTYKSTPGLWSLILLKKPTGYTEQDIEEYKKLVEQTNVIENPQNLRDNSHPERTWKWRKIFKNMEEEGHGIEFLPSDIISLKQELVYLLGEYRAGNTSATRNQIVAIADNLLKRKHISKLEYRRINDYISHDETCYKKQIWKHC